jgi:hypothetical protein
MIVDLEPVTDVPALMMKGRQKWICVADLHLGLEVQLRRAGFNIPSQTPKMLSSLEELASLGDNLLILGDVKHRILSVSYREDREIPPFLEKLMNVYGSILIVAGNHDGGLGDILPKRVGAAAGHGTGIEGIGAFHGHVWPSKQVMECAKIVMGHIHPSVQLVDSLGSKSNEKCWVRGRLRKRLVLERYETCPAELIVVPAFNPLLTGTPINRAIGSRLGPLFRNNIVNESTLRTYLLDGTNLGLP